MLAAQLSLVPSLLSEELHRAYLQGLYREESCGGEQLVFTAKKEMFFLNLRIINGLMLSQRITAVKMRHFSLTRAMPGRGCSASLDKLTLW